MSKLFVNTAGYTRITKAFRPELIQEVTSYLKVVLENAFTKMQPSYELDFKEDYGDLDLITLCPNSVDVSVLLRNRENLFPRISNITVNGNVISFLFRKTMLHDKIQPPDDDGLRSLSQACYFHIDIIRCSTELQFKNMVTYYRNGVVNNFLGQFLRAYHIKAGHNGVFYLYKDKRNNTVEIPIMEDYSRFFIDYFGLDLNDLVFHNFEELANYLVNVSFFCGVERYKKTNSSDKKRSMKLHGLANQLYQHIESGTNMTGNCESVALKPEHQEMVDKFVVDYELRLDINHNNRKSLFEFLESHGVPNTHYQEIFSTMMPILNKVKLDKAQSITRSVMQ